MSDASLDSEAKLLLARAGNCTVEKIWVLIAVDCKILSAVRSLSLPQNKKRKDKKKKTRGGTNLPKKVNSLGAKCRKRGFSRASYTRPARSYDAPRNM